MFIVLGLKRINLNAVSYYEGVCTPFRNKDSKMKKGNKYSVVIHYMNNKIKPVEFGCNSPEDANKIIDNIDECVGVEPKSYVTCNNKKYCL